MSNIFGSYFRVSTFGESHGGAVGAVIDGCPAGLGITPADIQQELDRRRPGQSELTTPRDEADQVHIYSGILDGVTLGTPISLVVFNKDQKSADYDHMKDVYRPGHADFTYDARYGVRDVRGGGRSSNRESVARVAAGAVAARLASDVAGISVLAWVDSVYDIRANVDMNSVTRADIEKLATRCPDADASALMTAAILDAKEKGNSLGGSVGFCIRNCPPGLGSPVFKKFSSDLAQALMSINATKAFSIGLGEAGSLLTGVEHNDPFDVDEQNVIRTVTNNAGGVLGGITSGATVYGKVTFKPVSTVSRSQNTVTKNKERTVLEAKGRHDPCVLPRAVPIVEAMISLVVADHLLAYVNASVERLKKFFN